VSPKVTRRSGTASEAARAERSGADATDTGGRQREAVRILVVEDDFFVALQAEAALIEAGFRVIGTVASAEQAIALAQAEAPALAVMDIRLAGRRDGVDAALELFHTLGIRCIFASAHDDSEVRRRAQPATPLGWLAKPYTMGSLIEMVCRALCELKEPRAK
jgi:DNA-binding NarL/FixJ family response regulator